MLPRAETRSTGMRYGIMLYPAASEPGIASASRAVIYTGLQRSAYSIGCLYCVCGMLRNRQADYHSSLILPCPLLDLLFARSASWCARDAPVSPNSAPQTRAAAGCSTPLVRVRPIVRLTPVNNACATLHKISGSSLQTRAVLYVCSKESGQV